MVGNDTGPEVSNVIFLAIMGLFIAAFTTYMTWLMVSLKGLSIQEYVDGKLEQLKQDALNDLKGES